jgi:hypothetical protein
MHHARLHRQSDLAVVRRPRLIRRYPTSPGRLRSIWSFERGAHRLTAIVPITGLIAWTPPALGERAGASRSPIIFQIVMRKVDGCQTIPEKPSDQIMDLAA